MALFPGVLEMIERDVENRIREAATEGAVVTKLHLNEPGTGIHWPHLPHRSSAPGEYPARQFGPLQQSVGVEKVAPVTFHVGSIHNPPPEAFSLEFDPISKGGRPWLSKSMEDPETHARMNIAAKGGG